MQDQNEAPIEHWREFNRRIAALEASKSQQSVESLLMKLRALLNKSGADFIKDEAFDILIELKAAAFIENHKEKKHFQAVYDGLKQKLSAPNEQFRKYLVALVGNKEQKRVLDLMSKVDKSIRLNNDLAESSSGPPPSFQRDNTMMVGHRPPLRCFYCSKLGHIQSRCFKRKRDLQADNLDPTASDPKRSKIGENSQ